MKQNAYVMMAFTDPVKLVIVYHWKKLVSVNVKQELI